MGVPKVGGREQSDGKDVMKDHLATILHFGLPEHGKESVNIISCLHKVKQF